jgi:hypothetical protein
MGADGAVSESGVWVCDAVGAIVSAFDEEG